MDAGRLSLASKRDWKDPVLVVGQIEDGAWKTYEVRGGPARLDVDEDTMTCLLIACERSEVGRWTQAVADAMRHPEKLPQ